MTAENLFPRRWLKQADIWPAVLMVAAICVGLLVLRSIGMNGSSVFVKRQLLWVLVGFVAFGFGVLVDCERIGRFARALYWANVALLIAVLLIGHATKGSVRWFSAGSVRFQPSELAKLITTLTLASLFAAHRDHIHRGSVFLLSVVHIAVPIVLILRQPDLGTALSIVAIWIGMAFIAGMPGRFIVLFVLGGLALFGLGWKLHIIQDYQIERLMAVVRPESDPAGASYQVRQSKIAIGSGRVFGKGLGHGTQAHRRFIPERQTDFIFTVAAEEGGFIVGIVIIAIYAALLVRGWMVVATTNDLTSRLVAAGILSMLGFHVLVNLGMTMGIMPVTGVPLPFMSYGGSSLAVSMASIGFLVGISARREPLVF
jgi:rod shape determining protein RodA